MKPPEDMTFGQRFLITIIIVLIILFGLAFIGWATGRWEDGPKVDAAPITAECIDIELQDKIRKLALQAFELAFVDRAQLLYDNWSKDDPKQHPHRHQVGMQNAINAYVYAIGLANNWSAKPCAPKPVGTQ